MVAVLGPVSGHPAWYLPVGATLDPDRCALLVETFRPDVLRVGRALRARVEAEHPGIRATAAVYAVRDICGTTMGYTRDPVVRGIGLAHLHDDLHGGPVVLPIIVAWETGAVHAVIDGKPWGPDRG